MLISAFPFYWMFVQATQKPENIFRFPPPLWFGSIEQALVNYHKVLEVIPFWTNLFNSAFISVTQTALVLFFCSMGGYAFAMYDFPGKRQLFIIMLATMMIPGIVQVIPWFIMMRWIGWINDFRGLIVPGAVNAFGIFWMRQYTQGSVPHELLDAARIDGCPEFLILFRVVMPLLKPALGALGIMTFMTTWNNFMQPLILLRETHRFTLPVALALLRGDPYRGTNYAVLMAGTAMAVLPVLIVFVMSAKKFMAGLTAGAIKG
ncbi:MAG: carbohydrate ABC transporter permease [Firmicutes bacterium]|nr:carbohydrate ABC transporter permease [Bacillota bacterium]